MFVDAWKSDCQRETDRKLAWIQRERSIVDRDAALSHECSIGHNHDAALCGSVFCCESEVFRNPLLANHFGLRSDILRLRSDDAHDAPREISKWCSSRIEDETAAICYVRVRACARRSYEAI